MRAQTAMRLSALQTRAAAVLAFVVVAAWMYSRPATSSTQVTSKASVLTLDVANERGAAVPCKRKYGAKFRSSTPQAKVSATKSTILVLTTDTKFVDKAVNTLSQVGNVCTLLAAQKNRVVSQWPVLS